VTPAAAVGAGSALFAALLLGATFLTLRTTGPVRARARRLAVTLSLGGAAVAAGAAAAGIAPRQVLAVAGVGVGIGMLACNRREALAFAATALTVAAAVVAVLTTNGPVVLPSTLDAAFSLTRTGAAATDSALRLISVVGVVVLPGVLVYQGYSYWVFRRRVASERLAGERTAA
jgi:cytochrome d ubiquinol oxidase subunit II